MVVDAAGPQVEPLVADEEPDRLRVGDVQHHLACPSVSICRLGIDDRLFFEEPVDVRAVREVVPGLLEVATEADVAVAQGEDRLVASERRGIEGGFADLPDVDGAS